MSSQESEERVTGMVRMGCKNGVPGEFLVYPCAETSLIDNEPVDCSETASGLRGQRSSVVRGWGSGVDTNTDVGDHGRPPLTMRAECAVLDGILSSIFSW